MNAAGLVIADDMVSDTTPSIVCLIPCVSYRVFHAILIAFQGGADITINAGETSPDYAKCVLDSRDLL